VSKRSAIIGLVAVAAVTAFFARDRLFPRKLPALVLETSQGGTVALRHGGSAAGDGVGHPDAHARRPGQAR